MRQGQEHVQSIHLRHDYVCNDQIRRPLAIQLKPLKTVGSLRDLIPRLFKSGAEERINAVIDIRIVAMEETLTIL
jgi:hypothetical protein